MSFVLDPGFDVSVFNNTSPKILGDGVDEHGNLWCFDDSHGFGTDYLKCIDTSGTVLASYTNTATIAEISAYNLANQAPATSWDTADFPGTGAGAILSDGANTYLVYYFSNSYDAASHFYNCLAVYSTAADGSRSLLGAVWSGSGGSAFSYILPVRAIGLCGRKTFNDPVMVWALNTNDGTVAGRVFPSINSIIGKASGFTGQIFRFSSGGSHTTYFNLGGSAPLKYGVNAPGYGAPVFLMPYGTDETRLFSYWGKSSMANNHTQYLAANWGVTCMWVEENAYATYPNGCLIAADLGTVVDPPYVTTTPAASFVTITPAVVPSALDGGAAFPDVNTYSDGTGAVSTNDYFPSPSMLDRASGLYSVGWYYPYFINNTYIIGTNWSFLAALRVMEYNPSSGNFTTTNFPSGALAPIDSIEPGGGGGGITYDFLDIVGFQGFWDGDVLRIWNINWSSGTSSAPFYTWLAHLGVDAVISAGDVVLVGCAKILVTALNEDGSYSGTVAEGDELPGVPDDPDGAALPVLAGDWGIVVPTDTVTGLGHLEGKEVWALADGRVEGPFIVSGGSITVSEPSSSIVVGLKYTQQIKTLYLTDEGLNAGTEQGKRKFFPAVTSRIDCTQGIEIGIDFDHLQPVPEAGDILFTGDARTLIEGDWETKGEVCIQQSLPLPASILGVIPEVVAGDTGN